MTATTTLGRRHFLGAMGAAAVLPGVAGCSPSDHVPKVEHPHTSGGSDTVFILLPGFRDHAEDFVEYGLVDTIHSEIGADVIATDATINYYTKGKITQFVGEDIVKPAAEKYRQVWLLGISMGGLGCSLVGRSYNDSVTGILMLAPFLGGKKIHKEIAAAGGPGSWEPSVQTEELGRDNFQDAIWEWLSGYAKGQPRPEMFLGAGTEDQGTGFELLAGTLPEERLFEQPGGHKWTTWATLWPGMLDAAKPFIEGQAVTDAA